MFASRTELGIIVFRGADMPSFTQCPAKVGPTCYPGDIKTCDSFALSDAVV